MMPSSAQTVFGFDARRADVAALYVDPFGPYPRLVREWYDVARGAESYAGPHPIVAHPLCGPWGSLRHLCTKQDPKLAILAVAQVREWGGVLEHPARSRLWRHLELPMPDAPEDAFGGRTIEVDQVRWGHPARKRTWLYIVRATRIGEMPPPKEHTHWVSGTHAYKLRHGHAPPNIKVCSAEQRRRTPIDFARWLIDIAASAVDNVNVNK